MRVRAAERQGARADYDLAIRDERARRVNRRTQARDFAVKIGQVDLLEIMSSEADRSATEKKPE